MSRWRCLCVPSFPRLPRDGPRLQVTASRSHRTDGRSPITSDEGGVSHLYVRPLDRADATLVRGTDGAEGPFFSPDGRHLGFFAASQLKQVALDGGAPVKICDAVGPRGAAWGPDGTIIFTPGGNDPLWRVPASGGTPERITTLDTEHHERTHRFPTILPDGRTVLFVAATTDIASYADAQIIAQPIAGGARKVVVQGGTSPQFAMGQLIYNRGDALVAVPFDVRRLEVTGGRSWSLPMSPGVRSSLPRRQRWRATGRSRTCQAAK